MNITRYTANEIINGAVRDVYTEVYVCVNKMCTNKTKKEKVAIAKRVTSSALKDIIRERAMLSRVFDLV